MQMLKQKNKSNAKVCMKQSFNHLNFNIIVVNNSKALKHIIALLLRR